MPAEPNDTWHQLLAGLQARKTASLRTLGWADPIELDSIAVVGHDFPRVGRMRREEAEVCNGLAATATLGLRACKPSARRNLWRLWLVVGIGLAACSSHGSHVGTSRTSSGGLTREQMLDARSCQPCHPTHYADWAESMHANASADPIFIAMNSRGQRETGGKLGKFCANCHAPMAVRDGKTVDGLNLGSLPTAYQGVTCFFCHTVSSVLGLHDAALALSGDRVLRAEYRDPFATTAHASAYSPMQDAVRSESASMCGGCHDVVVPQTGSPIEQSYYEWSHSVFSSPRGATCASCHMTPASTPGPIARVPHAPNRTRHAHTFPAVDVVLDRASPLRAAQEQNVKAALGHGVLQGALCVTAAPAIRVILDAVGVGHRWPSGAAQDRRAWTEVKAYRGGKIVYQSGVVPDATGVTSRSADSDLWLLRECLFDGQGKTVNMFWQAASTQANTLPALATSNPLDPRFYETHVVQRFPRDGSALAQTPDRVTLRVRLQPIGTDVVDDLVMSGDLDASIRAAVPTFDVPLGVGAAAAQLDWTSSTAASLTYAADDGTTATCAATRGFNVAATPTLAKSRVDCAP
jgi:hypothetical protein